MFKDININISINPSISSWLLFTEALIKSKKNNINIVFDKDYLLKMFNDYFSDVRESFKYNILLNFIDCAGH